MIVHTDCLTWLRSPPEGLAVDAVITDPPYCSGSVAEAARTAAKKQGIRAGGKTDQRFSWFVGDNMGTAGLAWTLREMAILTRSVVKAEGSLLCFMDWRMVPSLVPAIESAGLRYQNLIVWDKGNMGLGTGFRAQHELIAHFTYGKPNYHSKSFGNVLRAKRISAKARRHPTEKPRELLEPLVAVSTPEGGLVLDPFAGSGAVGEAAEALGREFIGLEWNEDYGI